MYKVGGVGLQELWVTSSTLIKCECPDKIKYLNSAPTRKPADTNILNRKCCIS